MSDKKPTPRVTEAPQADIYEPPPDTPADDITMRTVYDRLMTARAKCLQMARDVELIMNWLRKRG